MLVMCELMIFRYHQRKIDQDVDRQMITPADYSLVVKNIPSGMSGLEIEKELKQRIRNHAVKDHKTKTPIVVDVTKVVPVYNLHEFELVEKSISEEIKKK